FYNMRWDLTRSLNFDFSAINNARVDEPNGALNTKEKRDTMWRNFFNGGRTTQYSQKAIFSYNIPIGKFPLTDWITARYSYASNYNWIAASRIAISLGNTLENGQDNTLNAEFDFTRLYSKSRWLRGLDNVPLRQASGGRNNKNNNNGLPPTVNPKTGSLLASLPSKEEVLTNPKTGEKLAGKERRLALKKWRKQKRDAKKADRLMRNSQPVEMNDIEMFAGKMITMIKRVSANYTENFSSRVPGYMDSTQFLGQNFRSMEPGLDYVFGKQPDTAWLNRKGEKGLITRDSNYNSFYRQNFTQRLTVTTQIEPIRELIIDVNLDKSFSKEYTQLFKDTLNNGSRQLHLSPYAAGGFSVSYISFGTLFRNTNPNIISETFKQFEENRRILSARAAQNNPYWQQLNPNEQFTADGYAKGYGRYSQDVLIPSFLAAYTGKDANSVSLINQNNRNIRSNPFSGILPKPNWRVSYTGLSRIPSLQKVFTNINLTHGYTGNLSMNSFTSALNYFDPFRLGAPGFIDTVSGNYVPFFLLPNITMQESFSPLLGIDVTTNKQMNLKFEYKKSRQLSLSLVDYQLSETNSTEWTFGFSWRTKGLRLPLKLPFMKSSKLENDLNIKLDLSMRNDATTNSRLDQANAYGTGGQKVISIQPSIDYVLNRRINLKFFFDQRRVTPFISTSAPTIATRAGLQVRVSLAQ
ncbi:MAG: cell surface protein SprA, partial [Chitinophagaceae bacterium]